MSGDEVEYIRETENIEKHPYKFFLTEKLKNAPKLKFSKQNFLNFNFRTLKCRIVIDPLLLAENPILSCSV